MHSRFERLINPFDTSPTTTPPRSIWGFCLHYSRPHLHLFLLMAVMCFFYAVLEIYVVHFMGELITWSAEEERETFFSRHGFQLGTITVILLVFTPLVDFLANSILHQSIVGNFPMSIRWSVHRYLLGHSVSFYQNEFAGRLVTKLMQTALAVREMLTKVCDIFVYATVYAFSACVLLFSASPRLAAPVVVWLVAYGCIIKYFVPKLRDVAKEQADARSIMTGHVVDAYTNIHTVKLFSHAAREEAYVKQSMRTFLHTTYAQGRLITQLNLSLEFINSFSIFVSIFLSIYLWQTHAITSGAIAVAIAIPVRMRGMSHWILWELAGLSEEVGTIQDGIETISVPQTVVDAPRAQPLNLAESSIASAPYAIQFQNIQFHYGKSNGVIDDFNLSIRPGEKVGIVGRSGAGKSTIIKLLLRFYDLQSGKISVYNQDISLLTQESLRQAIGVVSQDTSLLHRSVRENITYGLPEATEAQVQEAIHQAQADEFISDLIDQDQRTGLDAHVGERGVKLSGGQRQRIAIARVLLKNAPILILDEATSALDSEVESAIQDQLYYLMQGKTVIAIAHRLSTIAAMDRIVVVDKGHIIEEGTHQELLRREGLYSQLWLRQSGGFLGDISADAHEVPTSSAPPSIAG